MVVDIGILLEIASVIHENAFLRAENENFREENKQLKRNALEQTRSTRLLEAEVAELRRDRLENAITDSARCSNCRSN